MSLSPPRVMLSIWTSLTVPARNTSILARASTPVKLAVEATSKLKSSPCCFSHVRAASSKKDTVQT